MLHCTFGGMMRILTETVCEEGVEAATKSAHTLYSIVKYSIANIV